MKRVMICEDDPLQAIFLVQEVELAGAEVCGCFEDSAEAWEAAQVLSPDLAIIDVNLADGPTGVGLALQLAALGCRVVVLTASSAPHPELGRIRHSFVAKPLPPGIISEIARSG